MPLLQVMEDICGSRMDVTSVYLVPESQEQLVEGDFSRTVVGKLISTTL